MDKYFINRVKGLLSRVTLSCLDKKLDMIVEWDQEYTIKDGSGDYLTNKEPRTYLKVICTTACRKTGKQELQHGRKWYLSKYMTDDEIIKTAFRAHRGFVQHEADEGFFVDGKAIFNPHTDFEELLKVCDKEVKRSEHANIQST